MIECGEIIYNKIEQGLLYISGDLFIMRHVRLWIPGMIISSSEFIMSSGSQCPIKMPERRLLQGVNWEKLGDCSLGTNGQQGKWVRVVWRCQGEKFCQSCHGDTKLWVWFYFLNRLTVFIMHIGVWSILKIVCGRVDHAMDNQL